MITTSFFHFRHQAVSKLFWMRVNRVLAWALIVSPFVQWALHLPLENSIQFDLVILLAHAAMSFALFGKPETRQRAFKISMHVLGFRPAGLTDRNRFLLSGYRIALAAIPIMLLATPFHGDVQVAALVLIYPVLRLQVSLIQHIYLAVKYAMKRWGMRDTATHGALIIVLLYLVVSIANFVR